MNATASPIARFRLHWSGCSDRGKVRTNNEDAFVGLRFNQQELERLGKEGQSTLQAADFVFAVSDGMGGAQAGEFASRIAVEKVPQILPKGFRSESGHPKADSAEVLLQVLFREIHKALVYLGRSYEECRGMETTLSLCWFAPGLLHFAHVGDSRIYYLPPTEAFASSPKTTPTWVGCIGRGRSMSARPEPTRGGMCSRRHWEEAISS